MLTGLNSYIQDFKSKMNSDFLSPLFVRLANLYYHDGQYEECINICNIGLLVYPEYITAKIILFKALLKLEFINEAENLLHDIESKYPDIETIKFFKNELNNIRRNNKQEKIYYSNKINTPVDFHNYSKKINSIISDRSNNFNIDDIVSIIHRSDKNDKLIDEREFIKFCNDFSGIKFDDLIPPHADHIKKSIEDKKNITTLNTFFSRIKIVTETLADILAKQGFFKESFEAYNILLQQDDSNKRRIQEKLYELERNF